MLPSGHWVALPSRGLRPSPMQGQGHASSWTPNRQPLPVGSLVPSQRRIEICHMQGWVQGVLVTVVTTSIPSQRRIEVCHMQRFGRSAGNVFQVSGGVQ